MLLYFLEIKQLRVKRVFSAGGRQYPAGEVGGDNMIRLTVFHGSTYPFISPRFKYKILRPRAIELAPN